MADITIIDTDGDKQKVCLKSKKGATVEQLLNAIGEGILEDSDRSLMLKHETLKKGTYYWTKKASGPSAEQDIKEVVDLLRRQKADEDTLVISQPKTERFDRALANFHFTKDAAKWENKPSADELHTPPQPHVWLRSKEHTQENRARYMEYLRNPNNIILPDNTQLFEGSSAKDLLSVRFFGFNNVKTSGNIDVIIAASHHQSIATVRQNILVGIELKKDTNTEHEKIERQVILQHLAASYLNPNTGILTIMTDLNDRWHFFYFAEGKRLLRYEASKSEAIFLIQHSLKESNEQGRLSTPNYFLKRACWNDMYPKLDNIPEANSFDQRDCKEANSEGENDRGSTHSKRGGRPSAQQGTSGDSKRYKGGDRQRGQMDDPSMDYMDEEERLEATLLREIQTSFHKMVYVPEVEGVEDIDIPPLEIF